MCTLAPFDNKNSTICKWPHLADVCNGVSPNYNKNTKLNNIDIYTYTLITTGRTIIQQAYPILRL